MVAIGVEKSLSNIALCEHRFLEKIKTLYKTAGNCDYQHHYKAILEAAMFSNTEGCTNNIPMTPTNMIPLKILVQENHPVNFHKHWVSKIRLLFVR